MTLFEMSLVIHILTVILWIGGVGFVTTIIVPLMMKKTPQLQEILFFQKVEHRFASIARIYAIIVGVTGLVNLQAMGGLTLSFFGEHLWASIMVGIYLLYVVILFVLEPLIVRKLLANVSSLGLEGLFFRINILHWVLLTLSLVALGAGIWGGHGF